ncbi:hypothetical protein PVL29_022957 [Vitis rotundifolia]|uniref:Uncharacterized protein n=1 Tax=Vitis rotundifolia TaxID=103349 RepID=A0AA39DBQ6_VITRO|nr:hypothetical protein PVL29_022957 [Vitis rotundifolia]
MANAIITLFLQYEPHTTTISALANIHSCLKRQEEDMHKLREQSTQDGDTPIFDLEITQRVLGKRSMQLNFLMKKQRSYDNKSQSYRSLKKTTTTQLEELKAMIQSLTPQQTNNSNQPPPYSSSTSQPPPPSS